MAVKDCGHHKDKKKELIKKILIGIAIILAILVLLILILWAIFRPKSPRFILQDATVYTFNLTGPAELTSIIQATVQAKNPNDRVGVYYSHMITYATYCDQQITLPTGIPPTYMDSNGMDIWSPFLRGDSVPIAPYIGAQLNQDRSIGVIRIVVKLDGQVRWKVGSLITGLYGIRVSCPAVIPFGGNDANNGVLVANNAVKYSLVQGCSVSV
ncbi:hypothetical protein Cgig2_017181 [Carnegiea gigantea]|uniref:Late embryogenesis abundant protein LEA-2 subgroup domain-containing protein n=1 Tax=Carnegiea gigantea TaxID=171969 RepID=A0A9Q1QA97_9CARY|nr:hypothetical protein Cgig2_017181 [Carnegiea gigantea]